MRPVPRWIRLIRWFLAVVYLVYGGIKLAGGQFWHGDFTIDSRTIEGPFFVWAFHGWSWPYSIFAALGEFVPGLLLLFNRTALIGALLLFPVTLNITVMTFAFGFPPVKFASLLYLVLIGILIAWDFPRLWQAVWPKEPPPVVRFSRAGKVLLALVGVPFLFIATTALTESLSTGPEKAVLERLVAQGVPRDSLQLTRSRYTGQLFNRAGFVEYHTKDSSRIFRAQVGRPISYVSWRVGPIEEKRP